MALDDRKLFTVDNFCFASASSVCICNKIYYYYTLLLYITSRFFFLDERKYTDTPRYTFPHINPLSVSLSLGYVYFTAVAIANQYSIT